MAGLAGIVAVEKGASWQWQWQWAERDHDGALSTARSTTDGCEADRRIASTDQARASLPPPASATLPMCVAEGNKLRRPYRDHAARVRSLGSSGRLRFVWAPTRAYGYGEASRGWVALPAVPRSTSCACGRGGCCASAATSPASHP